MYSDQIQDPIYFYIKILMYQLMTSLSTRAQRYAHVANIQVIMNEYGTGLLNILPNSKIGVTVFNVQAMILSLILKRPILEL